MKKPHHRSTTLDIPPVGDVPQHIAIIMDGNGRWASARGLPRVAGHERGLATLRSTVESCLDCGVRYLTVFAFSSENWRRPEQEVSFLMKLFVKALEREVSKLKVRGGRLRIVGDRSAFSLPLREAMARAEATTAGNDLFHLTVAVNYGGRWDILQATRKLLDQNPELARPGATLSEEMFSLHLSMAYAPEPDLFIRTGGEQRVSNFLIWQLAYTEFYFTESFWPDFDRTSLLQAIESYRRRERRFGRTSAQLAQCSAPVS